MWRPTPPARLPAPSVPPWLPAAPVGCCSASPWLPAAPSGCWPALQAMLLRPAAPSGRWPALQAMLLRPAAPSGCFSAPPLLHPDPSAAWQGLCPWPAGEGADTGARGEADRGKKVGAGCHGVGGKAVTQGRQRRGHMTAARARHSLINCCAVPPGSASAAEAPGWSLPSGWPGTAPARRPAPCCWCRTFSASPAARRES